MSPTFHTEASSDLPPQRPSAGQMLRTAREAQGLHLAVLSVNLKVSVRQLEALEADQHDAFKGATFVRALAQSVCRQLKIDPAPVLVALPQAAAPKTLEPVSLASRQAAAHPSARSTSSEAGKGLSRQVLLLAVMMLLGAAALIWWPNQSKEISTEEAQDPAQAAVPMGQASNPEEALVAASPESPASALAFMPASPAVSAQVPAAAPVASASVPAATPARVPASSPVLPVAASAVSGAEVSPLLLRLTADAWVEVRDNRGQMAVKRVVKAGETLKLDAVAPLFVYVGRSDSAELSWQGKPVDLKPHTQNNEARLQLKP